MRIISTLLAVAALGVIAAGVFIWSGVYNIAADEPHWQITIAVLETARERSVAHHSKGIVPPPLNNSGMALTGLKHFHETCRICHGAPGFRRSDFAMGLYPLPPDLSSKELQSEVTEASLFWVINHGFKMTGMPSFGETLEDNDIWNIVAFVERLPALSQSEYADMAKAAGLDIAQ